MGTLGQDVGREGLEAKYDDILTGIPGRIISAKCMLPLTANSSADSEYATRHRAAIGMSEVSDAIVIVVSEQTGIISVAIKGELDRNYD